MRKHHLVNTPLAWRAQVPQRQCYLVYQASCATFLGTISGMTISLCSVGHSNFSTGQISQLHNQYTQSWKPRESSGKHYNYIWNTVIKTTLHYKFHRTSRRGDDSDQPSAQLFAWTAALASAGWAGNSRAGCMPAPWAGLDISPLWGTQFRNLPCGTLSSFYK